MVGTFTIRVDSEQGPHVRLTLFGNGANCGQLCLRTDEAEEFISRLTDLTGDEAALHVKGGV